MRQKTIFLLLTIILSVVSIVSAQTATSSSDAAIKPSLAMGEVSSIDSSKIVLQTKDGAVDVSLSNKTEYKRVAPDNPSLKTAAASTFSEIGVGDKLVVTGIFAADKKSVPARTVYLMTKADISQKQAKESEQWKTRGITGKVTAINPQNNQISLEVRGLMSNSTVALSPKDNAVFRRYAPGSVSYSEARKSSLSEVQVGDSLRAYGDKGADGTTFAAEEVLTGAFQTVAGTIKSIDAVKGEIVISDIQTKKDVTVAVNSSSIVKKFPEEMAQKMAQFQAMRAGGQGGQGGFRPPQATTNAAAATDGGQNQNGGAGRGGIGGMRSAGGIDEMLDRFPNITVADLKVGDMIAASSTKGADVTKITAIKLLAGVEPFLKAPQAAAGGRNNGDRSGQGGFTIPGLDGIDVP